MTELFRCDRCGRRGLGRTELRAFDDRGSGLGHRSVSGVCAGPVRPELTSVARVAPPRTLRLWRFLRRLWRAAASLPL